MTGIENTARKINGKTFAVGVMFGAGLMLLLHSFDAVTITKKHQDTYHDTMVSAPTNSPTNAADDTMVSAPTNAPTNTPTNTPINTPDDTMNNTPDNMQNMHSFR